MEIKALTKLIMETKKIYDETSEFPLDKWEYISENLRQVALETRADEFLRLVEAFGSDKLYFDLDTIFISLIEAKPDYPPVELFTSYSSSYLIKDLRESCFLGGDFTPTPLLPVFSKVFAEWWNGDKELYYLLDDNVLQQSSLHELRLFIELIFTIVNKENPVDSIWYAMINSISLYLDKAVQNKYDSKEAWL